MRAAVAVILPLLALLLADNAAAQEPGPYEPVRRDPLGTRLVNGATPYTIGARKVEVIFTHRFQQTVNDGDEHDLWGLDGGADTGIGLGVGLTRHFDLSLYRVSFQEDYELAGKFLLLEQAPRVPLTLAVRAGADFLRREGVEDAERPFVQLLLARQLRPGVNLLLSPSWVADTPLLKNAFNVPVGITFPLPGSYLVELEVVPENGDLDASETAWHVALSKAVGGHIFEIVLGNSRASTVDQMLGGDFAAGFDSGDVRLGFNIVRDF
ncbi:MAG TPA: DUF5777 family beta-barrel protein [Thermoanaerobaculia bacterium]